MKPKLAFIHGWDYNYYNKFTHTQGKHIQYRAKLTTELEKEFEVQYFKLPGFFGETEPNKKLFDVTDFADAFSKWLQNNNASPDVIMGYSFGGAIALEYKTRYKSEIPWDPLESTCRHASLSIL